LSLPLYLLDTNIVGYLLNGRSPATRRRYASLEGNAVCAISAITEAEVRFGCERRPLATRLNQEVERLLVSMPSFPWDSAAAKACARLRVHVHSSGKAMEATDMLIAAHAMALNAVLVTRNNDFVAVNSLVRIENWATDL
jgi:tRNA(fMet)-specific endonuclease VapC